MAKIDLKTIVTQGAQRNDNEDTFNVDRTKYLNASEADNCIRWQWYAKHKPGLAEAQDWGYARRGKNAERFVVDSLKATNIHLLAAGDEQVSITNEEFKISATPDGVIGVPLRGDKMEYLGLEIKSIDPRTNRNNLPRGPHVTQIKIAMAIWNQHHPETPVKRGILMYIDASNFDDIVQHEVKVDPTILNQYKRRAQKVLRSKSVHALDREGRAGAGNDGCKYCPFTRDCGVQSSPDDSAQGRRRANRGSTLDVSVGSYMAAKNAEDAAKGAKARASEEIKADLRNRGRNEFTVGGYIVRLSSVKGRTTLDKKKVAAAGIDLSPYEKTGQPSERLSVEIAG